MSPRRRDGFAGLLEPPKVPAHLDLARADIDLVAPSSLRARRPVKLPVLVLPAVCPSEALNAPAAVLSHAALSQDMPLRAAWRAAMGRNR